MDVEDNNSETEQAINIGELLCEARDNLGLDTEKIAHELNLAVPVIENIEKNLFEQDIPLAFIRGYIKSYATKVGLDTAKVLATFDLQTGAESPTLKRVQVISKFDSKRRELNSSSWLVKSVSALLIFLFISYGGWLVVKKFIAKDTRSDIGLDISGDNQATAQVGEEIVLNTQTELNNSSQTNDKLSVAVNSSESPNQTLETSNQEPNATQSERILSSGVTSSDDNELISETSAVDNMTDSSEVDDSLAVNSDLETLIFKKLVLEFSADCWVRIVDARGEVIALGVKNAGKNMPIQGVKPISVILGDPSVVTMTYDEQSYDLSGYRAGRRVEIVLN